MWWAVREAAFGLQLMEEREGRAQAGGVPWLAATSPLRALFLLNPM